MSNFPENSLLVDDRDCSQVTATETFGGTLRIAVTQAGPRGINVAYAFLQPDAAKHLGEWLMAWSKERAPDCQRCGHSVLTTEGVMVGQRLEHRECADERLKK